MSRCDQLTEAFRAAKDAALAVQGEDDGGTANLDSLFLYTRRGLRTGVVEGAAANAGVTVRRHDSSWWRGWFVGGVSCGQGAMNSRMVEAAAKAMQEHGEDVGVYYAID